MTEKTTWAAVAVAVLVIAAAGVLVLAGPGSQKSGQALPSASGIPATAAIPVTAPASGSHPANGTDTCSLVPFHEETVPQAEGFSYYNTAVFTAVSAENYSSPVGNANAVITEAQAEMLARKAFPQVSPDRVTVEFVEGSRNTHAWNFELKSDETQLVLGTLQADTGDLLIYSIPSRAGAGPRVNASPTVSMEQARLAAENEIRLRNSGITLALTDSRIEQDGNYFFLYNRVIRGIPCSRDSISLDVDSGTGTVTRYFKSWFTPENAVAEQTSPAVSRDTATALVRGEAAACYPASAPSFRIVSADLQWMDVYNQEKYIPDPGVIPLTWHIRFDDDTIRAGEFPVPEEAWVDARNGTLLLMSYFHHH